jgi:hypothetical protein
MSHPSDRKSLREKWFPFYETLFKAYPLHQDFGGGFNAFLDLLEEDEVDPQLLLEKAEGYAQNVDDIRYVPHLKNWIKNRRFEDEDIFTDQAVALREWFTGAWRRGDARAVSEKYGFIYNHPPVPEGVEDLDSWHQDQRKVWIAKVANHILNGQAYPE